MRDPGRARGLARLLRFVAATIIACLTLAVLAAAPSAFAQTQSVPATRTVTTTVTVEGYDVDFTLPTNAKSGCMVCHGDVNLARLKDGKLVSYWIDVAVVEQSSHATVQCTGCHLEFAFKAPHTAEGADWASGAKSACANCHIDQAALMSQGAHRPLPANEATRAVAASTNPDAVRPLCGDCHGNHAIMILIDSKEGQDELRARGEEICGACHEDFWDSYNDYYHGAAFKRGANDAPSCWDCHRAHDVLPTDDKDSSVNERHIVETCKQCHPDANEEYVAYARLVHQRQAVAEEFFLYQWISAARSAVKRLFGA